MAVLVRKKVKVSKYDAFVDYPAWEESRHPRGGATNKGQFTFGPIATEPAVELEPEADAMSAANDLFPKSHVTRLYRAHPMSPNGRVSRVPSGYDGA